jgi:hypothetical protein
MLDLVAQLHLQSRKLEYVRPIETLVFDHSGPMCQIDTKHVSQYITPNHRLYYDAGTGYNLAEAQHLVNMPIKMLSYDVEQFATNESENVVTYGENFTGKVYCLRVPSEVFLVRRNGRCSFTGNSSRHGKLLLYYSSLYCV